MKIGIHLPQWGAYANRVGVLGVAQGVEEAGLDSVWVADHIVLPVETATNYPYSRDGKTSFQPSD